MRELLAIVRSDQFKAAVNALPGYQASDTTGTVTDMRLTLPTFGASRKRGTKPS